MARSGRKRKTGARERNGQLQRSHGPDRGTEQLQARRAWLAQGGDATKTCYPLGVMLVNDLIGEPEHSAGRRYGWLHLVLFGRATPATMNYDGVMRGNGLDGPADKITEFLEARQAELRACDLVLRDERTINGLYSLIIDENMPRWLVPPIQHSRNFRQFSHIVAGLQRLAVHMGYRPRIAKRLDRT